MSKAAFRILAICTLVAVIAAAFSVRHEWSRWGDNEHGARFFPELAENLDKVSRLTLRHRDATYTMERKPGGWVMIESDGFPARSKAIQDLLYALSETRRLEPKTQLPERYARLQVEDPTGAKSESVGIEIVDTDNKPLADLILGKENLLLSAIGEGGAYLRLPGEKQAWLASGNLLAGTAAKDWLDNPVADIRRQRFANAILRHPNGDVLVISNKGKGDDKLIVEGLAPDEKLISEYYPTDIARVWETFEVVGAKARDKVPFAEDATIEGRYETIDGLVIAFELTSIDGTDWLRINDVSTRNTGSSEAASEAKSLADRTRNFAFRIPEYESIHLKKDRAQVVQKTKPQS